MLYTDSQFLLGTHIDITIVSSDPKTPEKIAIIFDYFRGFEAEFSRFLLDSSLSQLNQRKTLQVSSRFIDLIQLSLWYHKSTDGFFNPLVQVAHLWYSHSFESGIFTEKNTPIDTDMSQIQVVWNTVSIGWDQELDFGGIGKWYAVDKAGEILRLFGYEDFFINAGGDIVAHGNNSSGVPWVIGIEDPFTGAIDSSFALLNQAVATSGRYKRNWKIDGKAHHHIVDGHTGENMDEIMSVTLIADECIDADVLTKKIFHLDPNEWIAAIEAHSLEWIIIAKDWKKYITSGIISRYHFSEQNA